MQYEGVEFFPAWLDRFESFLKTLYESPISRLNIAEIHQEIKESEHF